MLLHALGEISTCVAAVNVLAWMGLGIIAPFAHKLRFPYLASIYVGLLLFLLVMCTLYITPGIRLDYAVGVAALFCTIFSIVSVRVCGFAPFRATIAFSAALTFPVAVIAALIANWASITTGDAALLYVDGTDQLGYAHVADWMRNHPVSIFAEVTPDTPYQSFPNLMFKLFPRLGPFGYLGLVGMVRQVPSAFAYNLACSIALAAAALGVAAMFARTKAILALLVAGLLISHWYDFGQIGYLGKCMAYPAVLASIGLFIAMDDKPTSWSTALVLACASATALMLNGVVTGALLFFLGAGTVLVQRAISGRWNLDRMTIVALMAAISVATAGLITRPLPHYYPGSPFDLTDLVLRSLEFLGWAVSSDLGRLWIFPILGFAALLLLLMIALRRRAPIPIVLMAFPAILFVGLLAAGYRDEVFQLTGFFYPTMLCGGALLIADEVPRRSGYWIAATAVVIMVALRIPHFYAATMAYTRNVQPSSVYTLGELDRMAALIGTRRISVEFAQSNPQPAIMAMVELGRRGVNLQWAPDAWHNVVGAWRGWPAPHYDQPAELRLISPTADTPIADAIYRSPQFAILPATPR